MSVAIIKYNAGNIQSVLFALERIGCAATVTDNHEALLAADRVIFPGVGEASSAMNYLRERNLDRLITGLRQPVLGICLGMQLMCIHSDENNTDCLGIFDTSVKKFRFTEERLKVPHMGWNKLEDTQGELFNDITGDTYCYFVHSYYADVSKETIATTSYGTKFASALQKNNFYGVQFHPEKSAAVGQQLLENFLNIKKCS